MTGRLTQEMRITIADWQEENSKAFGALTTRNYAIHQKLMETGSVVDEQRSGRPRSGHSEENIRS